MIFRMWSRYGTTVQCNKISPYIKSGARNTQDPLSNRSIFRYYEWVHLVLEVPPLPPLSQSNPRHNRYECPPGLDEIQVNVKVNKQITINNLILTDQNPSPPMLLLLSLHNSSNPSLQHQTVRQQGRPSHLGLVPKNLRPVPLAARWDSSPPGLPGPTQWDPSSQQPGFPLNLLPGVEDDSIFLPNPTTATLFF